MIIDLRLRIGYWAIGLLGYLFIGLFLPSAYAQTMSNNNYIIKMQELNPTADINVDNKPTADNLNPSIPEETSFKVRMGIKNSVASHPFSILLTSNIIDFGILSPTNPIIRTVDLNTNSEAVYGYSVIVFENESLTASSSAKRAFIPDTTCDNGECSTENASEWTNTLTYGFGYRCDNITGVDCNDSFAKTNFYKHFPNIANNDDPQSIMAGVGSKDKTTRISYKINIPGTQAQGTYNNITTYIGVPNF